MISFSEEMWAKVLSGQKVRTWRLWPNGCRVREGSRHNVMVPNRFGSRQGVIDIDQVYREMLWGVDTEKAYLDGFFSAHAFRAYVHELYDRPYPTPGEERWNPKGYAVYFTPVTFVIAGIEVDAGEYLEEHRSSALRAET